MARVSPLWVATVGDGCCLGLLGHPSVAIVMRDSARPDVAGCLPAWPGCGQKRTGGQGGKLQARRDRGGAANFREEFEPGVVQGIAQTSRLPRGP